MVLKMLQRNSSQVLLSLSNIEEARDVFLL